MFPPSEKVLVTNVSLLCTPRVSHQIAPMVVTNVAIGKARAAYAQSFALWQQATTEFTCHDHSPRTLVATFNRSQVNISKHATITLLLLVRATYIQGVSQLLK